MILEEAADHDPEDGGRREEPGPEEASEPRPRVHTQEPPLDRRSHLVGCEPSAHDCTR